MTKENTSILRQELCERLPYDLKCKIWYRIQDDSFLKDEATLTPMWLTGSWNHIDDVTPYLRPMSSMTEEERAEMHNLLSPEGTAVYKNDGIAIPMSHFEEFVPYEFMGRILDYLNAHHFDYRGLIEKGLALEAPEGMY